MRRSPRCADERLQIFVCLTHGVAKKANHSGVARNSPVVLYNGRGTLRDGIFQLSTAIVTVHLLATTGCSC